MEKKTLWQKDSFDESSSNAFCEEYKKFLSECKTERRCVSEMISELKKAGAVSIEEATAGKKELKPGDLLYAVMMIMY